MTTVLVQVGVILGVLYALYASIRNVILNRDIAQGSKKITLLDTIIEAKNRDIAVDEADVKEKSDAYEKSKSDNRSKFDH